MNRLNTLSLRSSRYLAAALIVLTPTLLGQNTVRLAPGFPAAAGYQVLVADLHMHTIHSDGRVTPEIRIEEAYRDGLDVVALTDHLEGLLDKPDKVEAWVEGYARAADLAGDYGLIFLWGGEITKSFPQPGHYVTYFIPDPGKVVNKDYLLSAREAVRQGGLIHWAHPGQDWTEAAEVLYKEGLLMGVEIDNMTIDPDTWDTIRYQDDWFYPKALDWCLSRGLAPIGVTDAHGTIPPSDWGGPGPKRSVTLILASERSEKGVHDAFRARRTVACFNDMLWGEAKWLEAVWRGAVEVDDSLELTAGGSGMIRVRNRSAFPFRFIVNGDKDWVSTNREIILPPRAEAPLWLRAGREAPTGKISVLLTITPLNLFCGIDRHPALEERIELSIAGKE